MASKFKTLIHFLCRPLISNSGHSLGAVAAAAAAAAVVATAAVPNRTLLGPPLLIRKKVQSHRREESYTNPLFCPFYIPPSQC